MDNLRVFSSPVFGEIRTSMDSSGKVLFVAVDIARVLFFGGLPRVVGMYCKHVYQIPNPSCPKRLISAIGVSDVCRMAIRSKSKFVLEFHDWIFDEVLPALHDNCITGGCVTANNNQDKSLTAPSSFDSVSALRMSYESRISAIERNVNDIMKRLNCQDEYLSGCQTEDLNEYSTLSEYVKRHGIKLSYIVNGNYGMKATSICRRRGIEIKRIPDVSYGTVNLYPKYILREIFSNYSNN